MTSLFNEKSTIAIHNSAASSQDAAHETTPLLDLRSSQKVIENLQIYSSPLLNASSELLALLVSLPRQVSPLDIDKFRQQLFDGIADFKRRGLFLDYHPSVIEKSCFVFCAAFDETILYTPWGERSRWENHSLVSKIFNQRNGGEAFFTLLEQARRQPAKLVDFLELQYVLMMLGFLGKYRHHDAHRINELQSELYILIRHYREDVALSVPKTPHLPLIERPWGLFNVPKMLLLGLIIVSSVYLFSVFLHKGRSEPTLQAFSNLNMNGFPRAQTNLNVMPDDPAFISGDTSMQSVPHWDILLAVFSNSSDGRRLAKDLTAAGYKVKLNETVDGMELIVPNYTDLNQATVLKNELNVRFGFNALVRKSENKSTLNENK